MRLRLLIALAVLVACAIFAFIHFSDGLSAREKHSAFEAVLTTHAEECSRDLGAPYLLPFEDARSIQKGRATLEKLGLPFSGKGKATGDSSALIGVESVWRSTGGIVQITVVHQYGNNVVTHDYMLTRAGAAWIVEEVGGVFGCAFDY